MDDKNEENINKAFSKCLDLTARYLTQLHIMKRLEPKTEEEIEKFYKRVSCVDTKLEVICEEGNEFTIRSVVSYGGIEFERTSTRSGIDYHIFNSDFSEDSTIGKILKDEADRSIVILSAIYESLEIEYEDLALYTTPTKPADKSILSSTFEKFVRASIKQRLEKGI
jgi:hypothetical protein